MCVYVSNSSPKFIYGVYELKESSYKLHCSQCPLGKNLETAESSSGLVSETAMSRRHDLDSSSEETRLASLMVSLKILGTIPMSFL